MKNQRFADRTERFNAAKTTLAEGLDQISTDPEALAAYLRFRSHFRRFSMHNAVLIHSQRPGARHCMGFRQWQQHGRQVRKGQKGLVIFIPRIKTEKDDATGDEQTTLSGYVTGYVWDIAQTEPIPDAENVLEYVSPTPTIEGDDHAATLETLQDVTRHMGYTLVEDPHLLADGSCSYRTKTISLAARLSVNQKTLTLAHELAHAIAHAGKQRQTTKEAREIQAEAAAYMVCYALGLDTAKNSLPYLKSYETETDTVAVHLAEIERIGIHILDAFDRERTDYEALVSQLAA